MSDLIYYTIEVPIITLTLSDGATDQYPRAYIYKSNETLFETLDLPHIANGFYSVDTAETYIIADSIYTVVYKVFSDAGHTTPNTDYDIVEDKIRMIEISGTTADIADAVWDEPEIDHVTVGTYGYDVPIRPLYKAGGGVNINYDTMATKVWSHDKAGNLIKMIKAIKVVTDKIVTYKDKIIEKIKGIKIPETKTVDFPEMPKLDLKPILDKIDSIDIPKPKEIDLSPVLRRIDAIEIPEQMDYTDIIQNMLELLEKLKNKKLPNYDNQLDDIKRLIIDLTK